MLTGGCRYVDAKGEGRGISATSADNQCQTIALALVHRFADTFWLANPKLQVLTASAKQLRLLWSTTSLTPSGLQITTIRRG